MKDLSIDHYIENELKDPKFKAAFEAESARLDNAMTVMEARQQAKLTQQQLADLAGIPQSTVARIESGANTSVDTLSKIAKALNKKIELKFV